MTGRDELGLAEEGADSLFRPVQVGNPFEETMERLLQAIKLGFVPHGGKLPPERELAAQLQVSRTTLREAIGSLQRAGYVNSQRGRYGGTFVVYRQPVPAPGALREIAGDGGQELLDALVLRQILEVGAAELAAQRELKPEQRAALLGRLDELDRTGLTEYRPLDSRFHLAIAELTGSPSLVDAIARCRMRVNDLLNAIPVLAPNIRHSQAQHRVMLSAILDGDVEAARQATQEHLAATAALLRGFLN